MARKSLAKTRKARHRSNKTVRRTGKVGRKGRKSRRRTGGFDIVEYWNTNRTVKKNRHNIPGIAGVSSRKRMEKLQAQLVQLQDQMNEVQEELKGLQAAEDRFLEKQTGY